MPKIAAIQMCSSDDLKDNLKQARALISEAAQNGAEMVVLPEMFAMMGAKATDKVAIRETVGQGKIQDFLSKEALKNKIWLVGGTIPIATPSTPNKIRAACFVYDKNGQAIARYDKMHLFDVSISDQETYKESDTTEPGDELVVVDTPLGKLGLAVCYDIRFPPLFTELYLRGAQILAIPSAFTVPTGQAHWHALASARAIDSFCYVVGACQGGEHASGRKTYGHSLIVDPWGHILQQHSSKRPGVVYADVDLKYLNDIRSKFPLHEHYKIMSDVSNLKRDSEEKKASVQDISFW